MTILQNDFLILLEITYSVFLRVKLHHYVPGPTSLPNSRGDRWPWLSWTLTSKEFYVRVDILEEVSLVAAGHFSSYFRIVST